MNRYQDLTVDGPFDPLVTATALARAGLFDSHVVYEREQEWCYAGGALAELVLDADRLRVRFDGEETVEPLGDRPLAQVGAALQRLPIAGWNAYGWLAFELSYLAHRRADIPAGAPLLHVVVPQTEVRLRADRAVVRTTGQLPADDVRRFLANVPAEPARTPAPVAVDGYGAEMYQKSVAVAVDDIRRGELQKVILSRPVPIAGPVDLPATYVHGRRHNTPARSFLLDLGGWRAAGFSPETVVEVDDDGAVSTQPLAGTRAFGLGAEQDARLREELLGDAKEIFEHAISVKLGYEELLTVCDPDSVVVGDFMTVKPRGSVQHLGSRVLGQLAPGRTAWDALAALFPAITASGVPKEAAYERIVRLEPSARGLYSGAVLTASSNGSMDAALVLRALYEQDGHAWLRAGAGIVGDSVPARELEETREKLSSVAPHVIGAGPAAEAPAPAA
ncbi:salicylate synthase [Kitasatospora sp. CM 4170]|uniref:Salicylate synthase n=1 Tax=Kitasatospora aburaviensis TaxID=67265 RepID=A0ABW1F5B2_9ACTN|nr:salicylate synthase [Kitasatospora sp. CM 4170]WNM49226.1 salicylate synthase [Kitasatospora sp. CM 4170]